MGGQSQAFIAADIAESASSHPPSHYQPKTLAASSQTQEDTDAEQEDTNANQEDTDADSEDTDANQEDTDASQEDTDANQEDTNANYDEDIHIEPVAVVTDLETRLGNAQRKIDELEGALVSSRIAQDKDKASMSRLRAILKKANEKNHSLSSKLESVERDFARCQDERNNTIGKLEEDLGILQTANRDVDRLRRADARQITSLQEEQRVSKAQHQEELRDYKKMHDERSHKVVQQYIKAAKDAEWRHEREIQERDRSQAEVCRKQDQQHSKAIKEAQRVLNGCIGDLEAQKKDLEDKLNVQIDANHELESKVVLAQEQVFKKVDESLFLGDPDPTIINLFGSLSESIYFLAKAHSISVWPGADDTTTIEELGDKLKYLVLPDDIGDHRAFPHDLFRRTKNAPALCVSATLANMVCVRILEDPFWFFQDQGQMMKIYQSLEKADFFQAQKWRSQLLRLVQKIEKTGIQNPLVQLRRSATQLLAQGFLDSAPARYLLRPLVQNTNTDVLNREVRHIFEAASDLSLRLSCNRAKVKFFSDIFTVGREFTFRFGSKYVQGHLYHKLNKDTYGDDKRLTRFDGRMARILIFPIVLASGDEDGQGYNENHRVWSKGIYWMDEWN